MNSYKGEHVYPDDVIDKFRSIADDEALKRHRVELAKFVAKSFAAAGDELKVLGTIGQDDKPISSMGGSDETVTVSILLRIANQLVSAGADLFSDGRHYAAAALIRQVVEIEYLAWAVEARDQDGERWLRSNSKQRQSFFTPAKLRKAAKGKFRSYDYSVHCEIGGHPTPMAETILLNGDNAQAQLLLVDMLGHSGRIWDHVVRWAKSISHGNPIIKRNLKMCLKFNAWKSQDPLTNLPPPPELKF